MPRFCTQCGTPNADDAKFCEQCGTPLRRAADAQQVAPPAQPAATPAQPATLPPAASAPRSRGPGVWLVAILAMLLVLSAALAWWVFNRDGASPSQTELAAAASQWLQREHARLAQPACLRNFNYAADPVYVNGFDAQTQNWLDALVKIDVYTAPQRVTRGFLPQLEYRHGPQAATYIRDGALCAARGLAVQKVQIVTAGGATAADESSAQATPVLPADWARAEVTLKWTGLAPWAKQTPYAAEFTALGRPLQRTILLHHTAQGWALASDAEVAALQMQLTAQAVAAQSDQAAQGIASWWQQLTRAFGAQPVPDQAQPRAASGGGWFDWLRGLFVTDPARKLPVEFYTALAQGRVQDAYALLGTQFQILGPQKMQAALQLEAEKMRAKGGLKDVRVDAVSDTLGGKQVLCTLHFGDGSSKTERLIVGEVDGKWRILGGGNP